MLRLAGPTRVPRAARLIAALALVVTGVLTMPSAARAQRAAASPTASPAASPVDEFLDRIMSDVNDLRYAEAIQRGRSMGTSADAMTLAQRVRWRLLRAAAFYPNERAHQIADSALAQLRAAVVLAPDAQYAPAMRWRGLDSLLDHARRTTLAAVVRAPESQRVGSRSAPGAVEVVASREVQMILRTVERATGRETVHDTLVAESGTLTFTVHDERRVHLGPGVHDLTLTAEDLEGERITVRYEVAVEGEPPALVAEPVLAPASLLPEFVTPLRGALLTKGLVYSGLTVALATAARSDASLRDRFPADRRAYLISGAMLAGVGAFILGAKGQPIPANVESNLRVRAAHAREAEEVTAANRERLVGFTATVRIAREPR